MIPRVGTTWRHMRLGYVVNVDATIGGRVYFREPRDRRLALRTLEFAAFRVLFRPMTGAPLAALLLGCLLAAACGSGETSRAMLTVDAAAHADAHAGDVASTADAAPDAFASDAPIVITMVCIDAAAYPDRQRLSCDEACGSSGLRCLDHGCASAAGIAVDPSAAAEFGVTVYGPVDCAARDVSTGAVVTTFACSDGITLHASEADWLCCCGG